MGMAQEGERIAKNAIDALRQAPLALALLVINISFLVFVVYVLGQVSDTTRERNKDQINLVSDLVRDLRECRGGT